MLDGWQQAKLTAFGARDIQRGGQKCNDGGEVEDLLVEHRHGGTGRDGPLTRG